MRRPGLHSILTRFALLTLVALALACAASVAVSHAYNAADTMNEARKAVDVCATEVRGLLADVTYEDLTASEMSNTFIEATESIQKVCSLLHVRFLYVYEVDKASGEPSYHFAVSGDRNISLQLMEQMVANESAVKQGSSQELNALAGYADPAPIVTSSFLGRSLTWYYPLYVKGRDSALVMRIDVDDRVILRYILDNTLAFAIPMVIINILMALAQFLLLKLHVSDPLREVAQRMCSFVEGGVTNEEPLKLGRDDEIGEIANAYNKMTSDIGQYVKQIEGMTKERVAAETELEVARRIQQGIVPLSTEKAGDGFDAFASLRTARAVGGDFYGMTVLGDGRLLFLVGDVSGKGVSAALFMSMCLALLIEKLRSGSDPARAFNEVNASIASRNPENMFVTVLGGLFDPHSGTVTFANAGHLPPLVVGKGYLDCQPGMALGVFEDAGIQSETIKIKPGEGILLYTDGANEATNAQREFFGLERLARAVEGTTSSEQAVHAAASAIDAFVDGSEQFDDLTMLSFFAAPSEPGVLWHAAYDADVAALKEIREHMLPCFDSKDAGVRAMLACDELFTNVALYSGASVVEIWILDGEGETCVRLSDDGVPFDPFARVATEMDFEDYDQGGMGIMLARQACTRMEYERADGRNVVTLHFGA